MVPLQRRGRWWFTVQVGRARPLAAQHKRDTTLAAAGVVALGATPAVLQFSWGRGVDETWRSDESAAPRGGQRGQVGLGWGPEAGPST